MEDDDVVALPFGLLRNDVLYPDEHYALAACLRPGWTRFWADSGLQVTFLTGDTAKPRGATTIEVATGSLNMRQAPPKYRRYAAWGEVDTEEDRHGRQHRYHRTRVEGAEARALLERVSAGRDESWLWRYAGEKTAYAIERRTLAGPVRRVLDACEGRDGG